jgi:hypothetical protein
MATWKQKDLYFCGYIPADCVFKRDLKKLKKDFKEYFEGIRLKYETNNDGSVCLGFVVHDLEDDIHDVKFFAQRAETWICGYMMAKGVGIG